MFQLLVYLPEGLYLIGGIVLFLFVMYDFLFTTLSGNGAAPLTRFVSLTGHRILYFCAKGFGRRVYTLSGMFINILLLLGWASLVWVSLFMIFSSDPESILDKDNQIATNYERLYFTGFVLSTLGMGDITPSSPSFKLLTSCFSFFGFIFFTTSMTYLISVATAVIQKRSFSLTIHHLGTNPVSLAKTFVAMDRELTNQKLISLQEMIDRYSANHKAYPVIQFYSNHRTETTMSVNLAILDETVSMLLSTGQGNQFRSALLNLRLSLNHYLKHLDENYSDSLIRKKEPEIELPEYKLPEPENSEKHLSLEKRRAILGGLLRSENITWKDVYRHKHQNS